MSDKSDPEDYDDSDLYNDYDDDGEFDINKHLKKHSSIIGRILVLVLGFFLITVVIDPMTPGINESEIIYSAGSYPYDKFMTLFRDNPTDSDEDDLPDSEEINGWDRESSVLSMKPGDLTIYNFSVEYSGNYYVNLSILSSQSTRLSWGWDSPNSTLDLNTDDWMVKSLDRNTTPLSDGEHSLYIKVINGSISIDWIALVAPAKEYGIALDGRDVVATNGTITNMMVHVSTDPNNPDTDYDGMLDGYEVATGKRIGGWQDPRVTNNRFALLLAGGSTLSADNYPSIRHNVEYAYEVLHDFYGYSDKNIKVLSWDGDVGSLDVIDGMGNLQMISDTFDELEDEMGPNDFLFVYLTSHGVPGEIEVYRTPSKHDTFKYSMLEDNLTSLHDKTGVQSITVVVDACNSGSVIFDLKKDYILTIASTEADNPSYTSNNVHALFTHFFFEALEHPNLASLPSYEKVKNVEFTFEEHRFISLGEAFTIAGDKLRVQELSGRKQNPLMDQDGDGIADDDEDGKAYTTYI